jgi:hypothetical protein
MTHLRYDPTLGMSYDGMAESVTFELAGRLVALEIPFRDAHAVYELIQLSYRRGVLAGCAHMSRRVRAIEVEVQTLSGMP